MENMNLGSCAGCPVICHLVEQTDNLIAGNRAIAELATSQSVDDLGSEIFDVLSAQGIELPPLINGEDITHPAQVTAEIRKSSANLMNRIDTQVTENTNDIKRAILSCDGPIKMRATKAGRVITATVCNSPYAPNGESREEIHTFRKFAD